jgi:ammonia channel protein AmtB
LQVFWAASMLIEHFELDDVVLAVPVHLFCGMCDPHPGVQT